MPWPTPRPARRRAPPARPSDDRQREVNRLEYWLAAALLRPLGWLFARLPVQRSRVVLASPRKRTLDGNLLFIERALRADRPDLEVVQLMEPYAYGLLGKLGYAVRLIRGMYLLRTSPLFVVDNAYLPIHVSGHGQRTTVVQVWHAPGALKRFGLDTLGPVREPERTFLHRHYDWVVTSGEASRGAWSRAFRTPLEHVLPLGTPRTDLFFDAAAMAAARDRVLAAYPTLAGRRVVLCAPTFRGRGRAKRPGTALDAVQLRAALPPSDVLVLKSHPNLDPALVDPSGFDVVADPGDDINDLLVTADILITDYSSSIFEWALLRRPLVLLVGDLAEYERDPGLYVDYRSEMIGTQVSDTTGAIAAITAASTRTPDWAAFVARHLGGSDGRASQRFVERFAPPREGGSPDVPAPDHG
jgi:teichoic acid ribitol-phosphate primase